MNAGRTMLPTPDSTPTTPASIPTPNSAPTLDSASIPTRQPTQEAQSETSDVIIVECAPNAEPLLPEVNTASRAHEISAEFSEDNVLATRARCTNTRRQAYVAALDQSEAMKGYHSAFNAGFRTNYTAINYRLHQRIGKNCLVIRTRKDS